VITFLIALQHKRGYSVPLKVQPGALLSTDLGQTQSVSLYESHTTFCHLCTNQTRTNQ